MRLPRDSRTPNPPGTPRLRSSQIQVWSKLASAKWESEWMERLRFLDPSRIVVSGLRGKPTIRIEVIGIRPEEAGLLQRTFGGSLRTLDRKDWLVPSGRAVRPICIRGRLMLAPSEAVARDVRKRYPSRQVLVLPASIAFGTGDHPTTATCLRWLADFAEAREPGWSHLDAGTGTGILCLAARLLGADRAVGFDFDADAVRLALENADRNGVDGIRFVKRDVRVRFSRRQFDLVTANLFSSLLVAGAQGFAAAVRPGGVFIASGILVEQEAEVTRALRRAFGKKPDARLARGRWVTLRVDAPRNARPL